MLICPVCGEELFFYEKQARCCKGHSFDFAREGYINLLLGSRNGDTMGDDKQSARSRRDFLNKGYYRPLAEKLMGLLENANGALLDICCGEGYYTAHLASNPSLDVYGFDISKEMVRLAAKRRKGTYFVANMASIPVLDNSFDYAVHLFAPFNEREFERILKPGGRLFSVVPGRRHLWGLKQALYDTPYENDEHLPAVCDLDLLQIHRVHEKIYLNNKQDIAAVFQMTPYYYHTSAADKTKLECIDSMETDIEFVIAEYQKPEVQV